MEDNMFPKYQYSQFDVHHTGDQMVVRSNDETEFKKMVDYVRGLKTPQQPQPVKPTTPVVQPEVRVSVDQFEQDHNCPTHGVPMKQRESKKRDVKTGKPIIYWDHRRQENGVWEKCFGKGWKS